MRESTCRRGDGHQATLQNGWPAFVPARFRAVDLLSGKRRIMYYCCRFDVNLPTHHDHRLTLKLHPGNSQQCTPHARSYVMPQGSREPSFLDLAIAASSRRSRVPKRSALPDGKRSWTDIDIRGHASTIQIEDVPVHEKLDSSPQRGLRQPKISHISRVA